MEVPRYGEKAPPEGGRQGVVLEVFTAPDFGAPMCEVAEVRAVPGCGLEGDRHFASTSPRACPVTLIEIEALEALANERGIYLAPEESRRNVVTRGVRLNDLVGRTFLVGDVVLRGTALCHPCAHLEESTRAGVLRRLVQRGGLKADILTEGVIRRGASVFTGG